MIEKPLVSVVIPTYGRPEFLDRCIESVLKQTYQNIEIFVVDDNDPDTGVESLLRQKCVNTRKIHTLNI